ncbi:MAG: polyprenyl synthetase family protein [Thermoproteota archaeon]
MSKLQDEISTVAEEVNAYLRQLSSSRPGALSDAAFHLIKLGGKRLRPFVVMKCCELVGGSSDDALPAAVSIELLHNFTLIHDDAMDQDDFRHGAPTVHRVYGIPAAIIAGDLLFAMVFSHAYEAFTRRKIDPSIISKVIEVISEAAITVCEGQWMDMSLQKKYDISEELYLSLVAKKTGSLYQASAIVGGLVGGASDQELAKLASFGEKVGQAFQVVDDLLGAVGDPKITGKPVGSDLKNGKPTMILLHGVRTASPSERALILKVFGKQDASEKDVSEALNVLQKVGSISYGRRRAKEISEKAKAELSSFRDSESKLSLMEFCDFVVSRAF